MFARLSRMRSTLYRTNNKLASGLTQYLKPSTNTDVDCNVMVTLGCLQKLYKVAGYTPQASSKNSVGITGYLQQYVNETDLKLFYEDQRPDATNSSFDIVLVDGKSYFPSIWNVADY